MSAISPHRLLKIRPNKQLNNGKVSEVWSLDSTWMDDELMMD